MLRTIEVGTMRGKSKPRKFGSGDRIIICRPRRKLDAARSTALQLEALKNQLPVAQAIGGEAQRQAQYYATINTLLAQGKSEFDAIAVAQAQYRNAQAASVSSAQQGTQALADQNALQQAGYVSTVGMSQVQAAQAQQQALGQQAQLSAQQTYNKVLKDTGDEQTAYNAALEKGQSYQVAQAQAADRVKQAQLDAHRAALAWQADMLGVSDKAKQMADESVRAAEAFEQAAKAAQGVDFGRGGDFGNFSVPKGTQYVSGGGKLPTMADMGLEGIANNSLQYGGLNSAISNVQNMQAGSPVLNPLTAGKYGPVYGANNSESSILSQVQSLYELKNAQTNDNSVKLSNLNEEMAWLQSRPETIARDQKIVNLYDSIKQLTNSTDNLTAAQQASLNPLYNGRDALKVGYYHAATGLDVVAQGPSSGDTIPFHAMVNGGERIQITPAGQAANSGSAGSKITNVVQNFDFRGGTSNNSRRSVRQFAQGFGQMADAMR